MTLCRYSNEELDQFQQLLTHKLQESEREYNAFLLQLTEAANESVDSEKQDQSLRKETLYVRAARAKRNVDNLKSALLRIDNKTYGICIVTGTLIPKKRLLAVPHTSVNTEVALYPMRAGA